jgi:hypothetical protein
MPIELIAVDQSCADIVNISSSWDDVFDDHNLYLMSRRELVPILRQSLLICRDSLRRFLLVQSQPNVFALPMFHSLTGETFRAGLKRGLS